MSTVTRWDPFKELDELQNRFAHLWGRAAQRRADGRQEPITVADWAPLVDVIEDEHQYLIKAELPEVAKENVKVTVEQGILTLTGERRFEQEEKNKKYHRVERTYGSFARSFTVPEDADGTRVTAEFKEGVLTVRLPKSEQAKPRTIEVKVA